MEQVENLTRSVEDLTGEVTSLRREFRRRTFAIVAAAAALVVAGLVVGVIAVRVQLSNDRRLDASNQRWCPVVALLLPRPGDPPAATERARLFAKRAADLSRDFHCPNGA